MSMFFLSCFYNISITNIRDSGTSCGVTTVFCMKLLTQPSSGNSCSARLFAIISRNVIVEQTSYTAMLKMPGLVLDNLHEVLMSRGTR